MRRISLWAGLSLAMALLAGCPRPEYPNCKDDTTCTEKGEVCVEGKCQECATDANCREGFTCQANKCAPKPPECTTDATCGNGRICEAGKCADAQCKDDTQCPGGGKCQAGRCAAPTDTCTSNTDCGEGQECQNGRCAAAPVSRCDWSPVRFGFNEASLSSEAQQRLSELAQCMKSGQQGALTLAGHADERGTEEYNLQLSNRRAAAVKRYLTDLGVSAGSLKTVGYGETRPATNAASEEAWSENRRVEFER